MPIRRIAGATDELSDEALLAACALTEPAALGALFDRHHRRVRSFLSHLAGREADDLLQLTFETVQRQAHRFQGRSSVLTWILGIAKNIARRQHRTRVRHPAVALEVELVDPATPVDERLEEERQRRRLLAAVEVLSPKLKEVFVLVYLEGLSGPDAAKVLEIKEGALWKRLHEARLKVKAAMGEGA